MTSCRLSTRPLSSSQAKSRELMVFAVISSAVERSPKAKQYKIISLVPPTFHQSPFFLVHSPFHFTPKEFLSLLHSFHLIFPKTLNQFCTPIPYFLLPFSIFFSLLFIFYHSFFLFIVVIICYICAFVLFFLTSS